MQFCASTQIGKEMAGRVEMAVIVEGEGNWIFLQGQQHQREGIQWSSLKVAG